MGIPIDALARRARSNTAYGVHEAALLYTMKMRLIAARHETVTAKVVVYTALRSQRFDYDADDDEAERFLRFFFLPSFLCLFFFDL